MVFTDAERTLAANAVAATARSQEPKEIQDELPEDVAALKLLFDDSYAMLLPSQREAVDAAIAAIETQAGLCIFLDAPGGTGKTFSSNTLLAAVRKDGNIALAVASSGIAAILLELGRTFHSRCKASLKPAPDQMLNISAQTVIAQLFRSAKLILWDEGAMGNSDIGIAVQANGNGAGSEGVLVGRVAHGGKGVYGCSPFEGGR